MTAPDRTLQLERNTPLSGGFPITAADEDLPRVTRALYVGVTGDLSLVMADGSEITMTDVPVGFYPFSVAQVKAASDAGGLIGFY